MKLLAILDPQFRRADRNTVCYRSVAGVQLVHEALVPGVDTVLENLGNAFEEAIFALTLLR